MRDTRGSPPGNTGCLAVTLNEHQQMATTTMSRHVNAPRATVYRALLDSQAVATWNVPMGMTCHVHAFDAREAARSASR